MVAAMFTQAPITVEKPQVFEQVKAAIDAVFAPPHVENFLRSLQRARVRVRDFSGALNNNLLREGAQQLYAELGPSDQGQIREYYLSRLEQVEPRLREKFKRLYSYY